MTDDSTDLADWEINPGDVWADRRAVGPWETFVLLELGQNTVALGSWQGFFSAEGNGGGPVHANRQKIAEWETHEIVHNPNGTTSFAHNGWFLTAEDGGGDGSVCNWNRRAIGDWEQFWLEVDRNNGTIALRTYVEGTYVSVQEGVG